MLSARWRRLRLTSGASGLKLNLIQNRFIGVIFAQFKACRSDDFGKAYDQASRAVQQHFTLIQYVSKIRTEYGRISRAENLQFGSTSLDYHRAIVEVYFLSARNQVTPALFTMIQEDGIWRIENFEVFETWPLDRRLAGFSVVNLFSVRSDGGTDLLFLLFVWPGNDAARLSCALGGRMH